MTTSHPGKGRRRLVADILPEVDHCANWNRVRALYDQRARILDSRSGHVPDVLGEAFADAVLQISWSYTGREEQMCEHLLAVLADVTHQEILDLGLFRAHYNDDRGISASRFDGTCRRQPSLYESIVETCRRLRDARALREALVDTRTSGLLIGSTSYAPFCNVRGNRHGAPASDLDFIIAIERSEVLGTVVNALADLSRLSARDVDHLARRAHIFADHLDDGRTVFSQKIALWSDGASDPTLPPAVAPSDYLLSLHFMTPSVLEHVLVASTPRLAKDTVGARRTVRDYREAPRAQQDHVRTFAGQSYYLNLDTVPVEGGCLRSPRVYHIDQFDAYCPGFYQMMLIPQPSVAWDNLGVQPALNGFRAKLTERVRYEAGRRPYVMLRPSFAHVRREAFTPQIIRLLDEGY
ncbi:hypothetical protein [Nonomuraea guangzhouensis]|uniref:Nucleotidyltransferase domain-containing protein n=1 Tax=Nonomuraea guangzhouensis TaxID=1291555 RepID=A0ABW4GU61_9ACTN|nr:hypothetical protein [Nonomuraea guangzhouensis]